MLTDPPYLVHYRDRSGRRVINDDNDAWLKPAFRRSTASSEPTAFAYFPYGWNKVDTFMAAWREAGFAVVGHIVFRKHYASSAGIFLTTSTSQPTCWRRASRPCPHRPVPDVLDWQYSGNRLHPTQKPVQSLKPLISAFTKPGDVVLDPLCCRQHNGSSVALSVMWP